MGNKLTLSTALSYLSQVAQVTFSFPSFCLFPFRHWLKPRALSLTLRALVLSLKLPTPHPTAQLYDELNRSIPEPPPASTDSTGNPVAFSLPLLHILSPNGRPEFTACLSCCISLLCVVQQMEPWSPELYVCSTTVLAPHSVSLYLCICLSLSVSVPPPPSPSALSLLWNLRPVWNCLPRSTNLRSGLSLPVPPCSQYRRPLTSISRITVSTCLLPLNQTSQRYGTRGSEDGQRREPILSLRFPQPALIHPYLYSSRLPTTYLSVT